MMASRLSVTTVGNDEHAALIAACEPGVGLCTILNIEGSFSRRLGAQLAIGERFLTGSLSDGCLEAQLAADMRKLTHPRVIRYGAGSPKIDFRLPCGGGLDILLDPSPDRTACRRAFEQLNKRSPAELPLPPNPFLSRRRYLPSLRLLAFGEGPEFRCLEELADAMNLSLSSFDKTKLTLGRPAPECRPDAWTAALLLFHDHEWEGALLEQMLDSDAFYVGAQGGEKAREARTFDLIARGLSEEKVARIRSPVGLIPSCKTPRLVALSALAEICAQYERLLEHS